MSLENFLKEGERLLIFGIRPDTKFYIWILAANYAIRRYFSMTVSPTWYWKSELCWSNSHAKIPLSIRPTRNRYPTYSKGRMSCRIRFIGKVKMNYKVIILVFIKLPHKCTHKAATAQEMKIKMAFLERNLNPKVYIFNSTWSNICFGIFSKRPNMNKNIYNSSWEFI